jgi:hypothetical protein
MEKKKTIDLCLAAVVALIPASILGISVFIQYGGLLLNRESSVFLVNYWDCSRSVLQRVFDPLANDWGLYQARELSYFVDLLDANFIKASITLGAPHFFALSFFIFILGIMLIFQFFGRKIFMNLTDGTLLVVNIIFLLQPMVFLGNLFFRSAKPGCALMLAVVVFSLYGLLADRATKTRWFYAFIFGGELLMALFDRQGMFFVGAITVGLGLFLPVVAYFEQNPELNRKLRWLCFGSLCVVLLATLYNLYFGPWLIFLFNGYYPQGSFQALNIWGVFNIQGGLIFILTNIGGAFGGLDMGWGVALILLIGGALALPWYRHRRRSAAYLTGMFVFWLCSTTVAANLMVAQHPAILWADVIRSGYFLPNLVVLLFFFLQALNVVMEEFENNKNAGRILFCLLLAPVVGNILVLDNAVNGEAGGHQASELKRVQTILQILREPDMDYQSLMLTLREYNVVAAVRGEPVIRYEGSEDKIAEWIYLKED